MSFSALTYKENVVIWSTISSGSLLKRHVDLWSVVRNSSRGPNQVPPLILNVYNAFK